MKLKLKPRLKGKTFTFSLHLIKILNYIHYMLSEVMLENVSTSIMKK